MPTNRYQVLLSQVDDKGNLTLVDSTVIQSYTHCSAANLAKQHYPDLVVSRVTQEWEPLDRCHLCGGTIFKGDYEGDRIKQRNKKNVCLECL